MQEAKQYSEALESLEPSSQLPSDRPQLDARPCAACGSPVDPLRAKVVLRFDDGFRFLCDGSCETEFRAGARHRPAPRQVLKPLALPFDAPRTPSGHEIPLALPAPREQRPGGLWLAVSSLALAMLTGLWSQHFALALISSAFTAVTVLVALWASSATVKDVGPVAWLAGAAGALLAAFVALRDIELGAGSWLSIEGAALAAGAMVLRAYVDADAQRPLREAAFQLIAKFPARLHVPVANADDPLSTDLRMIEAEDVRAGQEIVALRGETLAVDGVVRAGEARVLPYPGASSPLRRRPGDTVLAGARVADGAIRVMATHVGPERSLARLSRFGSAPELDATALTRVSSLIASWGGPLAVLLALGAMLVAQSGAPSSPLAAAAAVLVAAPLLSVYRAIQSPRRAAGAAAGARGIIYRDGRALDAVGRVSTVTMSPQGTLTEGKPAVVECHALDGSDVKRLIGIAAAAERAAGDHPFARAVERFAREQHAPVLEVRRPVYHPGRGVTAISPDGQALVIGSRRMLLDEGISVAVADSEAARAEAAGRTPVFLAEGNRVRAVMTVQDELRVGARPAIQRIFDLGHEVVLLTGDQLGAVRHLAEALDVEHIKAELLPEERGQQVRSLRDAGNVVAALGRPGIDDPALAAADVSIELGAAGGVAGDRAVGLVVDDVRDAAAALFIAHAARAATLRATRICAVVFITVVGAASTGLLAPGLAALLAMAVDAHCLRAGTRLLRRIALRLPTGR
ncbi:MAG: HAD family hydrolase [Myxococcales bacterium]|nr:HAD family hydrolase [Myxococcales bacterium]